MQFTYDQAESLNYYRNLFEYAGDAIFVEDTYGKILDVNAAACKLFGYSREELLTMNAVELISCEGQEADIEKLINKEDYDECLNCYNVRKDGSIFPVTVRIRSYKENDGQRLIVSVRDITRQVEIMEKLQRQNEYMLLLHETSLGLLSRFDHYYVLKSILNKTCELFDCNDGYICLVDNENESIQFAIGEGRYADYNESFKFGEGAIGHVAQSKEPLIVEDYSNWPNRLTVEVCNDVQMSVCVPIIYDNKAIAVIGLDYYQQFCTFSSDKLRIFTLFAELAAIALVNADLHSAIAKSERDFQQKNYELMSANEQMKKSEEELCRKLEESMINKEKIRQHNIILGLINKTTLGLIHHQEIDEVLTTIVACANELFGTSDSYIYLVDQDKKVANIKIALGRNKNYIGYSQPFGEGVTGKVAETGEPLIIENYPEWLGRMTDPTWENIQTCVGVPLKSGQKVFGVIGLDYYYPRSFSTEELNLLNYFAELASIAYDNACMYEILDDIDKYSQEKREEVNAIYEELNAAEEKVRQQLEKLIMRDEDVRRHNIILDALHATAFGLIQRLEHDNVFETILVSAMKLADTEHGYISFLLEEGRIFARKFGLGYYEFDQERFVDFDKDLEGQVYITGKVVAISDYERWERKSEGITLETISSIVGIPLKTGNKVIGVIGLAFIEKQRNFAADELFLLERFGDLASVVLDNAMLLKSYKEEAIIRQKTETALLESEKKYRMLFESANDAIFIHDLNTGEVLDVNEKALELFQCRLEEMLTNGFSIFASDEPPYTEAEAKEYIRLAAAGKQQVFEWKNKRRDGSYRWMEVSLKRAKVGRDDKILGVIRDISERKQQEDIIRHMAYYDELTNLPNRAYLKEKLERELENTDEGERHGSFMIVDVDDLKIINDTFGHSYGDIIINKAGECMVALSDGTWTVARLGGDEFVVLIPGKSDFVQLSAIADELVRALNKSYDIGSYTVHMSASIGIARYPFDGKTTGDLLRSADLALYAAKADGKTSWQFYEAKTKIAAYEDVVLKQSLREVIERNELYLMFQPVVSVRTLRLVAFEALLRWNSPEYGMVPPNRFIPLAEESGAIKRIGRWVIEQACLFAARLAAIGKDDVKVAVNISPRQLITEDFIDSVSQAVNSSGIKPEQMIMEITENVLITAVEDSIANLSRLQQMGIAMALDDFGTGYCSLNYLRSLPVTTLKIDKSFIEQITVDESQMQFLKAIVNMAQVLGLKVVAEGVETNEQYRKILQCNCDFIQGYYFSKPIMEQDAINFKIKV